MLFSVILSDPSNPSFVPQDEVAAVIKTLQSSTRSLQHYCAHSKASKDTNLINHVPQLKRTLETILFKVKVRYHALCVCMDRSGTTMIVQW